ncbi:unnamed protein product [Kuraishia capsulata CBS 1993]|uniref:Glycosyltransferase family 15 protein n=1 Tax=Kuraishia capsulata CBS 1993 TaxID=1382522 RepID=W6MY43_9ASCO|nr:uncharacterized protein KUCA_T00005980001 [Kuraishia capsulata CBS 1993]CDK29985.1 unnamed protein product [Kuraishia capsulata CBS 1993]
MVRLNRRITRIALLGSLVTISVVLSVGHFSALRLSAEYNEQVSKVSQGLADYLEDFNIHFSDFFRGSSSDYGKEYGVGEMPWTEIQERLTFKEVTWKKPKKIVAENMEFYRKLLKTPIKEPKVDNLIRPPGKGQNYERASATFAVLVRNHELRGLASTIRQIESTFNHKYHYPYVLLNDKPFSSTFKKSIKSLVSGEVFFEQVPQETWDVPAEIDQDKMKAAMANLKAHNVGYADKLSYHNMCRYYSGEFFNHPRMQEFKYYWRIEPNTQYFCDIDYDVFKFMESEKKTYGFVISLYDIERSVESLWPTTLDFVAKNPGFVHPNASFSWLTENLQNPQKTSMANGYSTCHFWSNFEIGDLDFFRGEAYQRYIDALNDAGGFYYERWGDAPVHSIGLGLFEDRSKIHWFRDIGYKHDPYENAPNSVQCPKGKKAHIPGDFSYGHLYDQNCMANWVKYEMNDQLLGVY